MSNAEGEYYASCDACRGRKFKCTKERPVCEPCQRHGLPCKYSLKVVRTSLTRENLTAAESRVKLLEGALNTLFPGVDLDTVLLSIQPENPLPDVPAPQTSSNAPRQTEDHERDPALESLPLEADGFDWSEKETELNDVADGMAALSINPEGAGYLGATSSVVPLRALLHREETDQLDGSRDPDAWMNQFVLPSLTNNGRFSDISTSIFVDAYFRCYHTTYPFLYEPLFRSQFEGRSPRPKSHTWEILLNAVLALGAWCIGDDDSIMDDMFYQRVSRLPEDISIFETGNLALVQGLLLLSNYAQKRNRPNTGWNFLGLAVRMALSLGLHKEFPNWDISLLQRELRRRAWWGLYVFDSGASITFGRPILLPESGIMDASQVLNIHEQSLTPTMAILPSEIRGPTIYTSLILQSSFHFVTNSLHHRLISEPFPSPQELLALGRKIDAWQHTIPEYFESNSQEIQASDVLHFATFRLTWRYLNFKIILCRPIVLQWAARLRKTTAVSETNEELECRTNCIQSASATIKSIRDFLQLGSMSSRLSHWYMLYFLFQAGLVPVICLMSNPTHPDSNLWREDIAITKDLLRQTAPPNRLAARCLAVFNRLSPDLNPDMDFQAGGSWEGYDNLIVNDQLGGEMGFWDWANNEMNWTL